MKKLLEVHCIIIDYRYYDRDPEFETLKPKMEPLFKNSKGYPLDYLYILESEFPQTVLGKRFFLEKEEELLPKYRFMYCSTSAEISISAIIKTGSILGYSRIGTIQLRSVIESHPQRLIRLHKPDQQPGFICGIEY